MRFGRPFVIVAMTAIVAAATSAQTPFEGVITYSNAMRGHFRDGKMYVKGASARLEAPSQPGAFIVAADGRIIAVMDARHVYMVMGKRPTRAVSSAKFESLGKSEVIAGLRCEYYRAHDPGGPHDGESACITSELGFPGLFQGGPIGDMDANSLRAQFPKGFFILKSSNQRGETTTEIAKIERTALNDDLFAPPAGYTEMKMPGVPSPPRR